MVDSISSLELNPILLLYILLVVIIAMVPHELLHKFTAIRLGYLARYRLSKTLALLSLVSILLPFKIVATGYVAVYTLYALPRRDEGMIAISGPIVNLVIAVIVLYLYHSILGNYLLWYVLWINALVSFFNLLPIPPLDGWRIIRWNFIIWITMFSLSIGLLVYAYMV